MRESHLWADESIKVVCHELKKMDFISTTDWIHDSRHFAERVSPVVRHGYQIWAKPCSKWLHQSPLFARVMAILANWYIEDVKFELGVQTHRHWRGRLLRYALFTPGSWLLGVCSGLVKRELRIGGIRPAHID